MSVFNPGETAPPAASRAVAPVAGQAGFDEFVLARSGALLRTAYLLTRDPHWPRRGSPAGGSTAIRSPTCAGSS